MLSPIPGLSMRQLRKLAKKLDKECPEFRQMYEEQKKVNPDLDKDVEEWTEDLKESIDDK